MMYYGVLGCETRIGKKKGHIKSISKYIKEQVRSRKKEVIKQEKFSLSMLKG